LGLWACCCSP